jgi:hypothetical protein
MLSMQIMPAAASSTVDASTVDQYGAIVLNQVGCNTTAIVQIPHTGDLFMSRQMLTDDGKIAGITGPNDCSGATQNRWALTLTKFDWNTHTFTLLKAVLDTSVDPATKMSRAVITGGPMKGAVISSAYDPDVVRVDGEFFVVFECTIADAGNIYGVEGTSSCISVYDEVNQVLDLSRTQVIISGTQNDAAATVVTSASVPQLMTYHGRHYLYWSALTSDNGVFVSINIRGAELIDSDGNITVKGVGSRVVRSLDEPATIQVWATFPAEPMSDTAVDARAMWVTGDSIVGAAGLGGSGCTSPSGTEAGCFRFALAGTRNPLGSDTFNVGKPIDAASLPSNPQEYTRPIRDPAGDYWYIGHYIRPTANGVSNANPMPNAAFWQQYQGESALVMYPMLDASVWPRH